MTDFSLLEQHYPGLVSELKKQDEDELSPEELKIEVTASGNPCLRIRGVYVHSGRDPVREARRQVESLLIPHEVILNHDGPIVVLGFGLGYAAEAAALAAPGRPLIIVEKRRQLLRKALETRELGPFLLNNQIVFVLGDAHIMGALSLFKK